MATDTTKESNLQKEEATSLPELPKAGLLSRPIFFLFATVFFLILVVFDPLQRIALIFGQHAQQFIVRYLNFCLMSSLRILGVSFEIDGHENIPPEGPVIVISNHQSLFDIPILHSALHTLWPRFVAKKELAKWLPSVSFNLRYGGNGVIDRSDPRQAIPELQALAKRMTDGRFAVVIFPEGTRARDGKLKSFRPTGLSTLIQHAPSARILPAVIDETWVLSARYFGPVPWGVRVRVRVLSELDRSGLNPKEIVQRAETAIRQGLQEIRAKG